VVTTVGGSFWERLASGERRAIEQAAVRHTYRPEEYLCHEGDQSRHVIIVLSGHVRVLSHTADDREISIAIRRPGDIVGELSALHDRPRMATLQALERVEAITLPGSTFSRLCATRAKLSFALLLVISDRMHEAGRKHAEIGSAKASQRVYAQLLELALAQRRRNGVLEIRSGMTQQQLAESVATSRESYARTLRDLRSRGIVSTGRGWIVVHDIDELSRLAR
jgi:CRP/FNR family transcriptional regulator, cyclic AMP receptor protein